MFFICWPKKTIKVAVTIFKICNSEKICIFQHNFSLTMDLLQVNDVFHSLPEYDGKKPVWFSSLPEKILR